MWKSGKDCRKGKVFYIFRCFPMPKYLHNAMALGNLVPRRVKESHDASLESTFKGRSAPYLIAMASNLIAMASRLYTAMAMPSNLFNSDGLQPSLFGFQARKFATHPRLLQFCLC